MKETETQTTTEETDQELRQRARQVVRLLKKHYPDAECALVHDSPYQLLVAVILSAQCTDARVNMVTPKLFEKYPTLEELAEGRVQEIEKIIKSIGFSGSKSRHLKNMAQRVVEEYKGELPQTLEELITLAGVGRKTANVLLGTAWGIPSGVVVDTHVRRISNRLGLTTSQNPEVIERDLTALLPEKEWIMYSHRMIHHGRQICTARNPDCPNCPLLKICPRIGLPPLDPEDSDE